MSKHLAVLMAAIIVTGAGVAVAQEIDPNLVAWWTFEEGEGTVTSDMSGNGYDGAFVGDPEWAEGYNSDWAVRMVAEGTGVLYRLGADEVWPTGTLAIWAKADALAQPQYSSVFSGYNPSGTGFQLDTDGGDPGVYRTNPQTGNSFGPVVTEWVHLALTWENETASYYYDGQLATSGTFTLNNSTFNKFDVGNNRNEVNSFIGVVDDFRIYDRALSASEITGLAFRPKAYKPNPADDTVGVSNPLLTWTPGTTAVFHDVYLGTSPDLAEADLVGSRLPTALYWHVPGLTPGTQYYWRVDEIEADGTTHTGDVWTFFATPLEAWRPSPLDGYPYADPNVALGWAPGVGAVSYDVYLGANESDVAEGVADTFRGNTFTTGYVTGDLARGTTYYWRVDGVDSAGAKQTGNIWSFTTLPEMSTGDPNFICWWRIDEGIGTRVIDWSGHENHGPLVGEPQWVEGYDGRALNFDGVDDSVIYRFDDETFSAYTVSVWAKADVLSQSNNSSICATYGTTDGGFQFSFDVANSYQYHADVDQIMGPASLNWVHLAVTYDGTTATAYYNGDRVADFVPGADDLVLNKFAIGVNRAEDNWFAGAIDDFRVYDRALTQEAIGLVMRIDPLRAWQPAPTDGAIADIRRASPVTWAAGDGASQHDVYFGADQAAVADANAADATGIYRGRQGTTSYAPPEGIEWGQQYFWRVDEVTGDGSITRGAVWDFLVADYLIVDDFESYTNYSPKRVFQHWVDGLGFSPDEFFPDGDPGNGTTALVGYDIWSPDSPHYNGTIMETTDVYSGVQAMPVDYNNALTPWYAEATRTWATPQNWLFNDVNTLVIHFKGAPVDFLQTGPDSVTMSAAGTDIWGTTDEFRYVYKQLNGDGQIVARVDGIGDTHVWAKGGVMIRESLEPGSRHAMVVVTPGSGVAFQRRLINNDTSIGTTEAGVTAPHWVKLTRSGNEFTAQHSADGVTWVDVTNDTGETSDTVVMGGTIYIGLALTSHSAGVPTTAEFSGISTSGGVTGPWQMAEIGVAQPANSAGPLYVAVEDTSGSVGIVTHPDGDTAVLDATWRRWAIDLDELAGVNLTSVKRMAVGIGDRNNPQVDGSGVMLFDDFRITQGVPADPNVVE